MEVDCVVIDEAGQLSLGLASLVLRSLSPEGRLVIAGDSEQLAPILAAQYPAVEARLFGSILECVMFLSENLDAADSATPDIEHELDVEVVSELASSQASTIVQLTENFRCASVYSAGAVY
jgi:ATP-dependent exoDNAse (exonuclease V) alpha subunit